jgi:phosphoadenosine phosphosulfate reductase
MSKTRLDLPLLRDIVEAMSAQEAIRWALDNYHPRVAFASSFGAEDVVVMDLLLQERRDARIFTLDTGRLHEETHDVARRVRKRYGVAIETHVPDRARIERLLSEKGPFSFRESVPDRRECCEIRKIAPLRVALHGLDLWITGLRRGQAASRAAAPRLAWDDGFGLLKLNPIADWSEAQVWDYIRLHDLPYNALHDRGFPSIGCAPCTRAVGPGEDIRSGRWWWETSERKECGLHPERGAGDIQ